MGDEFAGASSCVDVALRLERRRIRLRRNEVRKYRRCHRGSWKCNERQRKTRQFRSDCKITQSKNQCTGTDRKDNRKTSGKKRKFCDNNRWNSRKHRKGHCLLRYLFTKRCFCGVWESPDLKTGGVGFWCKKEGKIGLSQLTVCGTLGINPITGVLIHKLSFLVMLTSSPRFDVARHF